jgi:hypothetical protein
MQRLLTDEIDLHGLTVAEAIAAFVTAYNRTLSRHPGGALRVVHGYGSSGEGGVILRRLRSFLEQHSKHLTWVAGENVDLNPGHTLVHPRKPLPTGLDRLSASILEYCSTPRTEEKIAGEFRKHTAREVKETIRRLKQNGSLREVLKNGHKTYSA